MQKIIKYTAILLVLEIIFCLGAFVPVQAQSPSITLSTHNGPPGTIVTVNGSGFTPDSSITLQYDNGPLISAGNANASGNFSTTFTVPPIDVFSSNNHTVKATDNGDPPRSAQATFYTPHITAQPNTGEGGTQVTLSGSGFAANETGIVATFNGSTITLNPSTPLVNSNGVWSATFTVPELPVGTYAIGARGNSGSEAFASFNIAVVTKITVNKTSGAVGTSVTVTGTGFAANETGVKVTFGGQQVGQTPVVNANGGWSTSFIIPPRPAGSYVIDASGNTTAASAVSDVSFTITPSFTINPAVAPPGASINAEGHGFRSNEEITVTYEITPGTHVAVCSAVADENGSWIASFVIPVSSGGSHAIRARGTSTSAINAPFRIGAGISLSTTSGPAGTTVTAEGGGFAASETGISVTFDGVPVGRTVTADKNGNWSLTFNVPIAAGGDHNVSASGRITAESAVESAYFTILPSITANKSSGTVGTPLTIRGTGFEAGEKGIEITFDGEDVDTTASADANGSWEITFNVPPSASGSHAIRVNSPITGEVNAEEILFVTVPGLTLKPAEGHVGASVSVYGSGFASESVITFFYDDNPLAKGQVRTNSSGNFNIPVTIPGSTAGTHSIRVVDGQNNEAVAEFLVEATVPAVPRLLKPDDGSRAGLTGGITPTLEWSRVDDPSGVTYSLQIDDDNDFNNPLVEKTGLTSTQYTLSKSESLPRGEYYWRVKAVDGASNESAWSPSFVLRSGAMSPAILAVIIILALGVLAAIAYFVIRPIILKRRNQGTAATPEIVIPQVVNAEYRTVEPEEERKRNIPFRLALPQAKQSRSPRGITPEDQARLKGIIEFARSLPLAEPGPNTNWLVELAENNTGSAASPALYAQMARGDLQVRYDPAWMQHPTYYDLQSLLYGQPVIEDLNSYVEAVNTAAAEAMIILQDIYADTTSEVSWDIFNAGGWGFISTVYIDAFNWFQGKYLREPSEKDYSVKPENGSGNETDSIWLYGERNTPFPGKLIRVQGEDEAAELRSLHLKLRRSYRNNERAREVVSMITQLEIQRRRLTGAFSQFNRLNPA